MSWECAHPTSKLTAQLWVSVLKSFLLICCKMKMREDKLHLTSVNANWPPFRPGSGVTFNKGIHTDQHGCISRTEAPMAPQFHEDSCTTASVVRACLKHRAHRHIFILHLRALCFHKDGAELERGTERDRDSETDGERGERQGQVHWWHWGTRACWDSRYQLQVRGDLLT